MEHPKPPPIHEVPIPPLNFVCPFCKTNLAIAPSYAGSTTTCQRCAGKFQIPLPTAQHGIYGGSPVQHGSNPMRDFANKKVAAGVCGIVFGGLGVHKFILGLNTPAVIMLVTSLAGLVTGSCLIFPIIALIAMYVIGVVEGITYLNKSDEDFYQTYAIQKKEWF